MKSLAIIVCAICAVFVLFISEPCEAWPVSNPEMINVRNFV